MLSPQQNSEAVNPLPEPEAQQGSRNWRARIALGVASVAVIAAIAFAVEAGGSDHNSAEPPSYSEITMTDNASAVSKDFAKEPTWTEDFSDTTDHSLDPADWLYDIGTGGPTNPKWGNNEAEYYTDNPDNVEIAGGALNIIARHQDYDGSDYTSARIKTENKFDVEYGEINVVAKLPRAVGTWPAIWMLSQDNKYYYRSGPSDKLRYLNPGEIDIMEEVGAQPGLVSSSAQSREYNPTDNTERVKFDKVPSLYTSYHDFGLEWTPTQLVFTVNGKPYHIVNEKSGDTYKAWPYNQPYYLLINDALGGSYGGEDRAKYPPNGINNTALPADFQIRSITYSKYIGPRAS